jgi:hypothetical protein
MTSSGRTPVSSGSINGLDALEGAKPHDRSRGDDGTECGRASRRSCPADSRGDRPHVPQRVVLVIAHNADFDRRFLERRLPVFATKHWACSRFDIDWKAEGIRSSALEFVAYSLGFFHEGHRAAIDCRATLHPLAQPLPGSGRLALEEPNAGGLQGSHLTNANGVESHVVDPASIAVPRRHRRAKADAIDGETLLRTLMTWQRGESRGCAMTVPPSPSEEDCRRVSRERATLLRERIQHTSASTSTKLVSKRATSCRFETMNPDGSPDKEFRPHRYGCLANKAAPPQKRPTEMAPSGRPSSRLLQRPL